ncbi:MAG: hypothetical protein EB072_00965 [Betaproteobacteria bacterium]|nr:hypothetical protein [Betaproteobacteria bacterium]
MKHSLAILATMFSLNLHAQPLQLVSEEEMKASAAVGGLPTPRSTPQAGAPRIELLTPDVKKPVNVPTKIEVKFSGNPPGEPKPESFKALYGAFKIDITQRLLGVAKVTKEGIQVTDASLPSGKHQLLLSLTDTLGRESQQVISFIVP